MKKLVRILSVITIIFVLATQTCFAGLNIESTYPEEGAKNVSLENMGIKVFTDGNFTAEKLGETNKNVCQIYDSEGNKVPTAVYYSEKEPNMILVLADRDSEGAIYVATSDSDYKLVISKGLTDDNGKTLSADTTIKFHTINQKRNNTINTIFMFGMIAIIMVLTTVSAKKKVEKETPKKDVAVNPYKQAKKTGKSVSEIVEKDQQSKAKQAEKDAKARAKYEKELQEADEERRADNYKVKGRASALKANSTYVAKKIEEKEAKKAQEKAWAEKAKKSKK